MIENEVCDIIGGPEAVDPLQVVHFVHLYEANRRDCIEVIGFFEELALLMDVNVADFDSLGFRSLDQFKEGF